MRTRRKNGGVSTEDDDTENEVPKRAKKEEDFSQYEQIRDQRIKDNLERMQKLGLFDLSLKLKPQKTNSQPQEKKKKTAHNALPPNQLPPRRSSRIMSLPPINYAARSSKKEENKSSKDDEGEIFIPEGTNPEVYTEEQCKLLGDCETDWELYVDGYDSDGDRIYDAIKGEPCHQCRQKTLALRTNCNKCELPKGQLCGDCLYTRYGENVIEANQNSKWTCPSCRGICNCACCRRAKGWMPIGNIYRKVSKLGFKSVAHYLIQTRPETCLEGSSEENSVAVEKSENSADTKLRRSIRIKGTMRS